MVAIEPSSRIRSNTRGVRAGSRVRALLGLPLLAVAALLAASGCASDSSDSSSTPTCNQECVDDWTGYGIVETLRVLYNGHVAGNSPDFNVPVNCGLGGTVTITGSASTDVLGTTSLDLNYAMLTCVSSDGANFSLTFTGAIDQDGTFNEIFGTDARTYASASLTMSGTANGEDVAQTCGVNISQTESGLTGILCGRSFAY